METTGYIIIPYHNSPLGNSDHEETGGYIIVSQYKGLGN